jgi:hypothetical protein
LSEGFVGAGCGAYVAVPSGCGGCDGVYGGWMFRVTVSYGLGWGIMNNKLRITCELEPYARVSGCRTQYLRVLTAEILVNLMRPGIYHTAGESRIKQLRW